MKRILSTAALFYALLIFSSCNEKAKLADSLTGTWNSVPERIQTSDAKATTTITRTLTFLNDEASNTGGDVNGAVKFSILKGTQLQDTDVQPISITTEGIATISGRWEAIDDDEIIVNWDYNSLKVDVDPNAVSLDYDIATQIDSEVLTSLKTAEIQYTKSVISAALQTQVFNYNRIDDIDFHNKATSMKVEINHKDFSFNKEL